MDLTSPKEIRSVQSKFGFTFKKGLGQNFLTSREVLDEIVRAAGQPDGILEIGPGFGTLTQSLAESAEKVVSIELDERLFPVLDYTLAEYDNVKIIHGDVMKTDLHSLIKTEFPDMSVSVAANLPYYITTPVITRLLEEKLPAKNIVVMVQKEVAERLSAREGTKDYGAITVLCRYCTEPEIVTVVPASMFVPPPKVDSAVLRMRVLPEPSVKVKDEKLFFKVVKAAFAQRRKTLLNCLCTAFPIPKAEMTEILTEAVKNPSRRGETLSFDEFAKISDIIYERTK